MEIFLKLFIINYDNKRLRDMSKKRIRKSLLFIHLFILIMFSGMGINYYFSDIPIGFDYWGTLIILLGTLPGILHMQNKGK